MDILQDQSCLVDLRATPTGKHLSQQPFTVMENAGLVLGSETLARPSDETVPDGKLQTDGDVQPVLERQQSCDLNKIPMMTPQLRKLKVKLGILTLTQSTRSSIRRLLRNNLLQTLFSRRFLLARPAKRNRNGEKLLTGPPNDCSLTAANGCTWSRPLFQHDAWDLTDA